MWFKYVQIFLNMVLGIIQARVSSHIQSSSTAEGTVVDSVLQEQTWK